MQMFPGKFWRFGVPELTDEDHCDELKYTKVEDKIYKRKLGDLDDEVQSSTII